MGQRLCRVCRHLISFHYYKCQRWRFLHVTDDELSWEVKRVAEITVLVGGRARMGFRSDPKARKSCPRHPSSICQSPGQRASVRI